MHPIDAVLARLADAESRVERLQGQQERTPGSSRVIAGVFKELQTILQDLRAAVGRLKDTTIRADAADTAVRTWEQRYADLVEALPIPCLWTDTTGTIIDANDAVATLLRTTRRHLRGKQLLLFIQDREKLRQLIASTQHEGDVARSELTIHPRDRRAETWQVIVRYLNVDQQCCWFFYRHIVPESEK